MLRNPQPIRLALWVFLSASSSVLFAANDDVQFARDVRPLLAKKCFACHGPDEENRQADLRLDDREAAVEAGAFDLQDLEESELLSRVFSKDPDTRMPPPDSHETLTDSERANLKTWVEAGAEYEKHWAFVRPQLPKVPDVRNGERTRNPIDNFILNRLEQEKLAFSPEADRYTLVRRVYLDLIGIPPTPAEADEFVDSTDPNAWDKLVEKLLRSPRYGERWARDWLDLARYADTNGYEKDRARSIWPYRDWVIRALNDDMPYDQFTIEQLAGDMLPNATDDQRIATGFHRNTMLNEEGGIDPLEFRFHAMVDRVGTTGTVWLGLTTGCAQCHTHKYDPILHTDFYRLMALMDNADEPDLFVKTRDILQRRKKIEDQLIGQRNAFYDRARKATTDAQLTQWYAAQHATSVPWQTLRPASMTTNLPKLKLLADGSILSTGDVTKRDVFELTFPVKAGMTAIRLEAIPDDRLPARGPGRAFYEGRKGDFFLSEIDATLNSKPIAFRTSSSSIKAQKFTPQNVFDDEGSSGWALSGKEGKPHQLVMNLTEPTTAAGQLKLTLLFERHYAASLGRFRISATNAIGKVSAKTMPVKVEAVLRKPNFASLNSAERNLVTRYYFDTAPRFAEQRKPLAAVERRLPKFPTTLVMQERPADNLRTTHRHHRGEYLSPREIVKATLPSLFESQQPPKNRLQFAKWLVSKENPLAARVAVNRAWRSFFGTGIVKTSGDFGTQSDPPSHPELIDWLATEVMRRGWSMKQLHRLIVTSATYRQSSNITAKLLERDPANRLLARGPRFRVNSEVVRDLMLSSSTLLSKKMFGPSVYPPQPASVTALAYGSTKWKPSAGEDRYRRSLYTFAKRTAPFAASMVFDGPSGETCLARRNRSNTPLQALTLLNDNMFQEMARAAAKSVAREKDAKENVASVFRKFVTRPPRADELKSLTHFYNEQLRRAKEGELNAEAICGKDATDELAALTLVARVVMNLDEVITKN